MPHPRASTLLALCCLLFVLAPVRAGEAPRATVHHDLRVTLDPTAHTLEVTDRITFPEGAASTTRADKTGVSFALHAGLEPECLTKGWRLSNEGTQHAVPGGSGDEAGKPEDLALEVFSLRPETPGADWPSEVTLRYHGKIHHPPEGMGAEYARSFARSPGTIGSEGAVLTHATYWVPTFGEDLLTFRLEAEVPPGWDVVSQGARSDHVRGEKGTRVTWTASHPMEEVYLIAAPFTVYEKDTGKLQALAYLRTPDENLASRYLDATGQYVAMYGKLIGPYPFAKFALVENFWETGYGMPSFTLLGPSVIRLPFILQSSYPHEILHNWWGNSVYVDWSTGNWCEGLTAYLADHLMKEMQGHGAEYRFDTLQKYRSYVLGGRDFPLSEFRSRHSGATEAVGYGKGLMLFHMLRRRIGDDLFRKGLRTFYRDFVWKRASFADLAKTFSEVSGQDLAPFFQAWVTRAGGPVLALSVEKDAKDGSLLVHVRQTQKDAPWPLLVPLAITRAGQKDAEMRRVPLDGREATLRLPAEGIVRLDLDPSFDVFRRLDTAEVPATLGQVFGAEHVTLVVPDPGSDPLAAAWRTLAETWSRASEGHDVSVVPASALSALPADRAVWVLGSANPMASALTPTLDAHGAGVTKDEIQYGQTSLARPGHAFVFVVRHPANQKLAVGWVGADDAAALPGLARKLPHYGKYSWLGFEGKAPDNVAKGQWQATDSPLVKVVAKDADGHAPARGALSPEEPLATLAPLFDEARLRQDVEWLASPERKGRGVGTPELDQVAEWIAKRFEEAGLRPGGDDGTYFQTWTEANGPDGKPVTLRNVIGILPGSNPKMAGQSVVVSAHYDHLGLGWPDVRAGNEGKIHPGADDNASGVSVVTELARVLGAELVPQRSIVFAAFSGEEWGLKGSRHYVQAMKLLPAKQAIADVNLDTVGRLDQGKLQVLGSGSAAEWRHIAMGVGYTTGVESVCIAQDPQGSDQASFLAAGVPAVQLFTGATADYHRPSDTPDKVDAAGLVKVATFTKETVTYLSERPGPLTPGEGLGTRRALPPAPAASRKVLVGTVPAFDHTGPGVLVEDVEAGSPAEKAGIRKGDLLLAIDGETLQGLRHYSQVLARHAPGDEIRVHLRRGDTELDVTVRLVAR